MKRDTRSAYRSRAKATESLVDAAVAEVRAESRARYDAASAKSASTEADRVKLTRDDILGTTHVRTRHGWHKVSKVNAATVSVETPYSWTDRYPFHQILEARTVAT